MNPGVLRYELMISAASTGHHDALKLSIDKVDNPSQYEPELWDTAIGGIEGADDGVRTGVARAVV